MNVTHNNAFSFQKPVADAVLDARIAETIAVLDRAIAQAADVWPVAFTTSLGAEDMVLTHLIASTNKYRQRISVLTLDTGRLPEGTYRLLALLPKHYPNFQVSTFTAKAELTESYIKMYGINGFYDSVEARKACCAARKSEPLVRALTGFRGWITGLRRAQSITREALALESIDADSGRTKFNPLANWSEAEVWAFIKRFAVPYNELHDQFYPSIGCAPCTRAISIGEDVRAGRWWWENADSKECGLHVSQPAAAAHALTQPLAQPASESTLA